MPKFLDKLFGRKDKSVNMADATIGRGDPEDRIPEEYLGEQAVSVIDSMKAFGIEPYNPDDLVGKKGLDVYRTMSRRGDAAKNGLTTKIMARLSSGYEYVPPDPEVEPRGEEMVELLKFNEEHIKGSMLEIIRRVMWNGLRDGYSITEENYRVYGDEAGKWKGFIGHASLKTKFSKDFDFLTDDYGNILRKGEKHVIDEKEVISEHDGLIQGQGTSSEKELSPDKFAIFSYNGESGNHYGTSEFRAAYRPYWAKDAFIKMWGINRERFGSPILYASIVKAIEDTEEGPKGGTVTAEQKLKALKVLKALQVATVFYKPQGIEVGAIETGKAGTVVDFDKDCSYMDRAIFRAILLPALLMEEGRRSGSLALGKTHGKLFTYILEFLGHMIEEVFNDQIFNRLIALNFANPKAFPKMKFRPFTEDQILFFSKIIFDAVENGILDPKDPMIRERLGFPPVDEATAKRIKEEAGKTDADEDVPDRPEPEMSDLNGRDQFIDRYMQRHIVPYLERESPASDWPRHESLGTYVRFVEMQTRNAKNGKATSQTPSEKDLVAVPNRPLTDIEKATDFEAIQKEWKQLSDTTVDRLKEIMGIVEIDVKRQVDKVIKTRNVGLIDKVHLPGRAMNDFRKTFQEFYLVDYTNGVRHSLREIEKKTGEKFEDVPNWVSGSFSDLFQDIPAFEPEEALAFLRGKDAEIRTGLRSYNRRAFTVTAVEDERVLADVKMTLETGLARGSSPRAIAAEIDAIFDAYTQEGIDVAGVLKTPARLETIVRANLSEAFNSGRRAAFESKRVSPFVQSYEYVAVIDPRTTDFCESYDGFTHPKNHPIWDTIWPPNHFNCRSMVVAALKGEKFTNSETIPPIQPSKGFRL